MTETQQPTIAETCCSCTVIITRTNCACACTGVGIHRAAGVLLRPSPGCDAQLLHGPSAPQRGCWQLPLRSALHIPSFICPFARFVHSFIHVSWIISTVVCALGLHSQLCSQQPHKLPLSHRPHGSLQPDCWGFSSGAIRVAQLRVDVFLWVYDNVQADTLHMVLISAAHD